MSPLNIFIGWDARETAAYDACVRSLLANSSVPLKIRPIKQAELVAAGHFDRPSRFPQETASTEFAFTRFLVPALADYQGWALFVDCDFIFSRDVAELFALCDEQFAVMCVKHDYIPRASVKMDGQKQLAYPRKNWSSLMLFQCDQPECRRLTSEVVSSESGAFLHRFEWCSDERIGEVPLTWNWLEGEYDKPSEPPAAVHYTNGGPWFANYRDVDFAELFWKYATTPQRRVA